MKKLFLAVSFSLIFFLIGCTQTNKALARNLDSTISSLIYCVSNLDLLDSSSLNNVNYITNNLNKNINNGTIRANSNLELENNIDAENENDNDLTTTDITEAENEQNSIIFSKKDEILIKTNTLDDNFADNKEQCYDKHNTIKEKNANIERELNNIGENLENDINNAKNDANINLSDDIEEKTKSFENKNVINSENINSDTIKNYASDISISNNLPSETDTTYGDIYTTLESSSKRIEKLISDLVNIRTVIMLYISDLYNGTIKLSQEDIESINSYANIIKESTAYLKANIGSVKNHINEATSLSNSGSSASLANSHIIKATETLNTRCAKLESAIVATYNIADIIKNSLDGTSSEINNLQNLTNLSQTEETLASPAPLGNFNFFSGSPNYAMNNPINMGVNGMRYMPYGYNTGAYNGFGSYGYNNYGTNYGFLPYAYDAYNMAPYGMYGYNNFGGMPMQNFGFSNGIIGQNGINPYNYCDYNYGMGSNYGYNPYMIDNSINTPNNILDNNNKNNILNENAIMPNVLTGLVSNDSQEQLSNKLSSNSNSQEDVKTATNEVNSNNKSLKISSKLVPQKTKKGIVPKRVGNTTPKLEKAQNVPYKQ